MQGENHIDYEKLYHEQKKKREQLQQILELQKIKIRKLVSNKIKGKICPKCYQESHQEKQEKNANIKEDLKEFSEKIGNVLDKKSKNQQHKDYKGKLKRTNTLNIDNHLSDSALLSRKQDPNPLTMIDNFTVFGVGEQNIRKNIQKVSNLGFEPELLYSFKPPSDLDNQASKLIFPSGIALKNVLGQKAKDKAIQMMSFCYTNLKSFVLRFKCQQNVNAEEFQKNPFLMHLNPEKSLFCLCIGISDYTTIDNGMSNKNKQKNTSLNIIEDNPIKQILDDDDMIQELGPISTGQNTSGNCSSDKSTNYIDCKITMSQRVFCISSYYPFFSFYEQILRNLINIVKMQRLMIYKHKGQDIQETDSHFQLSRMKQLFIICMNDLNSKKVLFNRSYELKLINQQKLTLLTDWNLAKSFFIQQWIFAILNMFNIQTFIDVLTLVMLEDRIVFICQNSHILTYTIYLFSCLLIRPFTYAFQVVSIIPEQDFLGAPFPVIYGMLRKKKYITQSNIFRDYKNTYIFLSPQNIEIVYTENKKNLLKCKPQKLKNELTVPFKQLKKFRKTDQKSTKYEMQASQYALSTMLEQREMAVHIIEKINQHMLHEVVSKLPTQIEINNLRNSIDLQNLPAQKDEHSYLMDQIKIIVKKNTKQPFIEKLLETQMMSMYVWK